MSPVQEMALFDALPEGLKDMLRTSVVGIPAGAVAHLLMQGLSPEEIERQLRQAIGCRPEPPPNRRRVTGEPRRGRIRP
jgi:hypothetical protein